MLVELLKGPLHPSTWENKAYVSVNVELSYLGLSLMVTRETASSAWHDETEARW